MKKVRINSETCIGCGACILDCPSKVIELKNKKATIVSDECIKCGHCIAICPVDAVRIDEYDDNEIIDYESMGEKMTSDQLMNAIKSLRTIRSFKKGSIDQAAIKEIIEAGRFTATAGNGQHVRYIVVRKHIKAIEAPVLKQLQLIQRLMKIAAKFKKSKYDLNKFKFSEGFLFKHAPVLIIAVSESVLDAGLATRSMELMANAKGFGGLYVGFFTRLGNKNKKVRRMLGLSKKEKIVTCLALGIPDVTYYRTVPRNKASIAWK